jgi:hypothetical protein
VSDIFIERVIKMKKRFLALLLVLCMVMSLLSVTAWASGEATKVSTADALKDAVANGGNIQLTEDITVTAQLEVTKDTTIDLNRHTITGDGVRAIHVAGGKLTLTGTGTVTSVGSVLYNSSVIRVGDDTATGNAELYIDENVTIEAPACYGVTIFGSATTETLTVAGKIHATGDHDKQNSATKSTDQCAISGNGDSKYKNDTTITIKSTAEVTAVTDAAIYHPQSGKLIIEGGTISGTTGIEAKAGETEIEVTGNPTIKATKETTSHMPYGDGTSTQGYAIAVVENSAYAGSAKVTINSGNYTGPVAVVADNTVSENAKGSLVINGGTFDDVSALNYLADNANVVVDLKNKTVEYTTADCDSEGYIAVNSANATVEIKNGTIRSPKRGIKWNAGKLTLTNVTMTAVERTIGIYKGGEVTVDADSVLTTTQTSGDCDVGIIAYYGKNTTGSETTHPVLNVYGSVINKGSEAAISTNGTDKTKPVINVYDGAVITSENALAMYIPNCGTVNIYGGDITGVGSAIGFKNGTLNIEGGTLIATGESTTPPEGYSNGINPSGAAIQLEDNDAYYYADSEHVGQITVNITGGTIISQNSYAIYEYIGMQKNKDGTVTALASDSRVKSLSISGNTTKISGKLGIIGVSNELANKQTKATTGKEIIQVSGGIFSAEVPTAYIVTGSTNLDNPDTTTNTTYPVKVGVKTTSLTLDASATATYGTDLTLSYSAEPTDHTNPIEWSSSDPSIATVSNGVVHPLKAGTVTITAKVDDITKTCVVTVNKANVSSLKLTPSTTSLEGGGTVTMTVAVEPTAADVEVTCSDSSITVSKNSDGTFTATLPNATVQYTFTAAVKSTDPCYQGSVTLPVSVTRYVAATTSASTSTSNKTDKTDDKTDDTATTLPTETGDVANTQVAPEVVSVETVTDAETGTVTTTTEKSDGSTTVVEEKTDGTVTTTDTSAEGAVKVVEKTTDGTVTTTDTAVNGVETYTKEVPGEQIKATVTIPEEVESAVVTIPVSGELTSGMVAMDADTGEIIMLSALTEDGLSLKLDSSRNIVIVDNSKSFTDVAADNWAADGVSFASSRGILIGTGENTFAPDATLDRRTALTGLARLAGVDTTGGDTWYEQAVEWAKETGISDGSNLEGDLPREQLATLLYRAAGSPEVDSSDVRYTDADQISSYATDAIAWATENGIMTGNPDGSVNPNGTANRAQYSTMLSRYAAYQMNH